MKSTEDLKTEIEALEVKAQKIKATAQKAGRAMTAAERSLVNDMYEMVNELEVEMGNRGGGPMTLQKNMLGDRPSTGLFNSFGEQLKAIAMAGTPGGQTDARLYNASGLNETTPSEGGFLVHSDFSTALLTEAREGAVLAPRCNRVQIGGNANGIVLPALDETSRATGSRWGGIRSYWVAEADEKTASKPKFRKIELNLKKLVGLCYATDELLQDSTVLEKIVREGFAGEISFTLDDVILRGTGAGQPLGILNSGALVTVDKIEDQTAGTVLPENIFEMFSRLPAESHRNAAWFINQALQPQLHTMGVGVGTAGGTLVYMPPGGMSQAPYGTLLGMPVFPIEQAPSPGSVGDILLADLSRYILAEKGGLQSDMSIHVRFVHDESVFRFVLRVDGQPIPNSPVTSYQGAVPMSPFIALEGRE